MTRIIPLHKIRQIVAKISPQRLIKSMEDGFVAYSDGRTMTSPASYLAFERSPGDMHIKAGYINGEKICVVKVASSFYDNPKVGLPSSGGVMLVFNQKTGSLQAVLLDEGYLTDVRTGIAGAVVAKYFAPTTVGAIGIVGTGTQARFQLQYLKEMLDCSKVYVYGRSRVALEQYIKAMQAFKLDIIATEDIADITSNCNYIVTTTPSGEPLIMSSQIKPGTHITAVGADAPGKQELDPHILKKADMIVVDSISQCKDHGEVFYAVKQQLVTPEQLIELGDCIRTKKCRENDDQITVADLTGLAVQDIQVAGLVWDISR